MSKSQARALNLHRLGSGRKWCHSHSSRSPDADKVTPSLGKRNKGETDNPFVFSFLLSSCPIKTRVIAAKSYSDIRHWDGTLHNNATETCWKRLVLIQEQNNLDELSVLRLLFTPFMLNENNLRHIKLMNIGLRSKWSQVIDPRSDAGGRLPRGESVFSYSLMMLLVCTLIVSHAL